MYSSNPYKEPWFQDSVWELFYSNYSPITSPFQTSRYACIHALSSVCNGALSMACIGALSMACIDVLLMACIDVLSMNCLYIPLSKKTLKRLNFINLGKCMNSLLPIPPPPHTTKCWTWRRFRMHILMPKNCAICKPCNNG